MGKVQSNNYLEKHANFPAFLLEQVPHDLALIIVIPCYNEPNIIPTLNSLKNCQSHGFSTEIIVVLNESEADIEAVKAQNQQTLIKIEDFKTTHNLTSLHPIYIKETLAKKAGVGFARKTGMDEAVRRLDRVSTDQKIIVCLDADTIVEDNYLQEIFNYFKKHPKCPAASIHYEHPLDDSDEAVNQSILDYELHLRYYVLAQRWAGLHYAHQTVGSAMAVRSLDYQKQGGMNTRKAGEDFYFIHKFTHYLTFGNITDTKVIPSARVSDRVPFGTGRAMQTILASDLPLDTYAPQSFVAIKKWIDQLPLLYEGRDNVKYSEVMFSFLRNYQFSKKLEEIKANSTDFASFEKRFFQWFNAFLCMKFLHFSRDQYFPNIPIKQAANWLNEIYFKNIGPITELELLIKFRAKTKSNS